MRPLLGERIADPLHMPRRTIDEEHVEAAVALGPAREIEPRRGDQARALRGRDAFGGAAEVAGAAHAHLGKHERALFFGNEVDLAETAAPVALDELEARRAHELGTEVFGSRAFAVHGTLNEWERAPVDRNALCRSHADRQPRRCEPALA